MAHQDFDVRVVGAQVWDPLNDNIDVEVILADGRKFGATFFTLQNLQRLFDRNRATGECCGGLYLWAVNMILVETLTMDVIRNTVEDMLNNGELFSAFSGLDSQ